MKRLTLCFACLLMILTLAPSLHAAQPAPATQADLAAQIFAPASCATASPADPAKAAPADLLLPAPRLASCTYAVCISECNDCPYPKHGYCISTASCTCGCR
jgi:hypothetical protein